MDEDGSGSVTEEEFKGALIKLRMASQWVRFCPTCQYRHDCAFCLEAKICPNCSDKRFCQKCWDHHPGRGNHQVRVHAQFPVHRVQALVAHGHLSPQPFFPRTHMRCVEGREKGVFITVSIPKCI